MPFLPIVLLLAWQALSRSASFALGWATALYFGQIPGNRGRILAIIALVSAAWVVLIVGFALPLGIGAALDALGVIGRNFSIDALIVIELGVALVVAPPVIAAIAEVGGFEEDRSFTRWLSRVPVSYPVAASLGVAVLEMVCITPVLLFLRFRRQQRLLTVPLVLHRGEETDELVDVIGAALRSIGVSEVERKELTGALSYPVRTMGFAAKHLLGSVVKGSPVRMRADGVEIVAYATNISILGRPEDAYPVRAAIGRELVFGDAFLTWTNDAQKLEAKLSRLADEIEKGGQDRHALARALEKVQDEIDHASVAIDEWNLLYRKRLQIERHARLLEVAGRADPERPATPPRRSDAERMVRSR